ncbi:MULTISPECIES: preprotein translocase subunit SecE [Megasphaera]|uniref:Protein translocase subunit SecE n=1 Tax=Megasphaera vaginalis (ex Srinivasan et al. 2021) TaxID=1111454 RepID=U7UVD4_9FIRM|nr:MULTISPECIES: preprotein translocase subunit SecE [Megasphaera]ERT62433.1 preprotein translocase, SecE subunit [Megasphaera vaginalis (ex Srinivasan et al. 2021)]
MSLSASEKAVQKNKRKKDSGRFLQGVKAEMKKVIWPTKKELINYTVMVIVATIVVMAIIAVSDGVFSQLFRLLRAAIG